MTALEKRIRTELLSMQADPAAKGFEYLVTAMLLINENRSLMSSICSLYNAVADKHKVDSSNVERCIRSQVKSKIIRPFPWNKLSTTTNVTVGNFIAGFFNYIIINEIV